MGKRKAATVLRLRALLVLMASAVVGGQILLPPALASPLVDYLVPNHGPTGGGTTIVIVGEGFEAGATVTMAGVDTTGVTVVDDRTITATTPDVVSPQLAEVVVTNPDAVSGSRTDGFLFVSTVYYVDGATGSNGNDGLSPEAAKATIQAALDIYSGGDPSEPPIEIRIAEGVYDENITIYYNEVVTGGWASGFLDRDPNTYLTVVDGGRRRMVARSYGLGVSPVLDGVTLIGGEEVQGYAGGFYVTDDAVTFSNSVIVGNRAGGFGGGFYEWFQDEVPTSTVRDNVFVSNRAASGGGGLALTTNEAHLFPHAFPLAVPVITDNVVVGNRSRDGGGILVYPDLADKLGAELRGNRIIGNLSVGTGAGLALLSLESNIIEVSMVNCLVTGNLSGDVGGGLYIGGRGAQSLELHWNTFEDNDSLFSGTQIFQSTQSPGTGQIENQITWGAAPLFLGSGMTVSYSNVQGGYVGIGNIDSDPLLAAGVLGEHYLSQTATGDPLQSVDSPSLDAADPSPSADAGLVLRWVDDAGSSPTVQDRSTRTDGLSDTGNLDQGYHWPTPSIMAGLAPTLQRSDPQIVSYHGDEWMVLRGSGFEDRSLVRCNGEDAAETILVSGSILLARTAALTRGPLGIEVRNPGPDGQPGTGDDLVASLGGLTAGDTEPPYWPGPAGVQVAEDLEECDAAIGIEWAAAADLDSPPVTYEVYRTDVDPIFVAEFLPNAGTLVAEGLSGLWWVDTGVTKNIPYWYIVQTRDSSEDPIRDLNILLSSFEGTTPTETEGDTEPPPSVGNTLALSTLDDGGTIDLEWQPVYPALQYRVYRSLDPSVVVDPPNEIALLQDQQASHLTDDTVPADDLLFYQVASEDGCGNQAY